MGHGVPAALIAAMLKAAVLSVRSVADDPSAVLRGLNQVLSAQRPRQLVSAAYLWIDTTRALARYAASGHPPLLRSRGGTVERIESNGLIFGMADESAYPVSTLPVQRGDRFILYTDGMTDAENAAGELFGDQRLDEVLRQHESTSASNLVPVLVRAVTQWRPAGSEPSDDITIVIVDVL